VEKDIAEWERNKGKLGSGAKLLTAQVENCKTIGYPHAHRLREYRHRLIRPGGELAFLAAGGTIC